MPIAPFLADHRARWVKVLSLHVLNGWIWIVAKSIVPLLLLAPLYLDMAESLKHFGRHVQHQQLTPFFLATYPSRGIFRGEDPASEKTETSSKLPAAICLLKTWRHRAQAASATRISNSNGPARTKRLVSRVPNGRTAVLVAARFAASWLN